MKTIEHRIGGTDTAGASTRRAQVWDPAKGEAQAEVLLAEKSDVDAAVEVAKKAFDSWRDVSLTRRARVMFAFGDLVERNLDRLAEIVSDEHGKVLSDAKGEVTQAKAITSRWPDVEFSEHHRTHMHFPTAV